MSPCQSGGLIVCLKNMACQSLEMLNTRECLPWELSCGLTRLVIFMCNHKVEY
ncbi:hypothetical protein Patl1_20880 [Pistacia atlantica]|uniref:Uncharacterized protein n=1 Tax=Pistacia atlantica TaxID=434234 RepID=A0ACC1BMH0_9ROSI|nr:hypothetical protein Patl1_20880 [Pistacia atlantica]